MPFLEGGGGQLHTYVVALNATTPTLICSGERKPTARRALMLQNPSVIDIYWSENPAVATTGANRGFRLAAGATFSDVMTNQSIYGIADSGTPTVVVGEVY